MNIETAKKNLRQEMLSLLKIIPRDIFKREGETASKILSADLLWKKHNKLLIFLSMENEIDTMPLIKTAFIEKKEVYIPCIENKIMKFYKIKKPDESFRNGAFGIREPREITNETLFNIKDGKALIITPGLAFDKSGNRLGRGAGFYDCFLNDNPAQENISVIGLCLQAQIVPKIPIEDFDYKLDGVCTGAFFYKTRPKPL